MLPSLLAGLFLAAGPGPAFGDDPAHDLAVSLATRAEMHERFTRATLIQTALINGQLANARHWARQLAGIAPDARDLDDLSARFGTLADALAEAESLTAAAAGAARLANACGACHERQGLRADRFESSTEVPAGDRVEEQMARHIWAADRFWEALIGRSDRSWTRGAAALTEAPLAPPGLLADGEAAMLVEEVASLGEAAWAASRWGERTDLYGQFLARCAACHEQFRDAGD